MKRGINNKLPAAVLLVLLSLVFLLLLLGVVKIQGVRGDDEGIDLSGDQEVQDEDHQPLASSHHDDVIISSEDSGGGSGGVLDHPEHRALSKGEKLFYAAIEALYIDRNFTHAVEVLHLGADEGHGKSMSLLAMLYSHGIGVNRSEAKAILYHEFAAMSGSMESHLALSHRYEHGIGVPQSCPLAALHAKVAANDAAKNHAKNLDAKVDMVDLDKKESQVDEVTSVKNDLVNVHYFRAEKGAADSKMFLGYAYMLGLNGVQQDGHLAERYFLECVDMGNAGAHGGLGQLYSQGVSTAKPPIERNYEKALYHFQQGAEAEHPVSLNGLGFLYAQGVGVEQNFKTAHKFFSLSHNKNNAEGTYNLGVLTLHGKGIAKDLPAAAGYFTQAAFRGSVLANWQLAHMNMKGTGGLPKSCKAALTNYRLVLERGPWVRRLSTAQEAYDEGDTAAALLDYLISAESGYSIGLKNAAHILSRGHTFDDGVELMRGSHSMSQEEATNQILLALLRRSAQEGNNEAHVKLGDAYYEGKGVEKDWAKAEEHYSIAATHNHPQALFNLGLLHQYGSSHGGSGGIQQDFFLAKRYFDNVLQIAPTSFYAAKAALFWLNWHWWYVHFTGMSTVPGPNGETDSRVDWFGWLWGAQDGASAKPAPGTTSPSATKNAGSAKGGDAGFWKSFQAWEKALPKPMGYPIDTVILTFCIGLAAALLLLRHHAV